MRYAYTLRQPLGGRSLVHTDSTYIIARTVGFSVRDAYWIAAYSEATDLGTFVPRDMRGNPVPNARALTTEDIGGLVRTHSATGGFLFHFLPTMRGPHDPTATTPRARTAVLDNGLLPALQLRNPEARLRAVTATGCRLGVPAFPGSPAC